MTATARADDPLLVLAKPAYYELRHLGFVNWYLFDAQDIDVEGRIALVGPNGSGKSSIFDGMQTVLTGGHRQYLKLNASAQKDGKSDRSVRDYCLGTLDDVPEVDETGVYVQRDECLSYILMGFRRTDTRREVTVGMGFSASREAREATVEAMFIVEGRMLRTADFTTSYEENGETWTRELPWAAVRARLDEDETLTLTVEKTSTAFVKSMVRLLGPENAFIDHMRFLRNLKNASTFKEANNTTEFVRTFILDAPEVDVSSLRTSIANYKAIQAKIAELRRRLESANDLKGRYDSLTTRRRTFARQSFVAGHADILLARQGLRKSEERNVELTARYDDLEKKLVDATRARADKRRALDELNQIVLQSDAERSRREVLGQIEILNGKRREALANLVPLGRFLAGGRALAPQITTLNKGLAEALATLPETADPATLDSAAAILGGPISGDLKQTLEKLQKQATAADRDLQDAEDELKELRENINRVSQGKAIISGKTQDLMLLLNKAGIAATPLCELVEDVDEHWRGALEAVMGDRREALIVDPTDYEQALAVYRKAGLHGGLIINTTKTDETRPPKPGSLATVIKTSDRHARAFLDFQLGRILMVETEAELRREDTAITADRMYTAGRATRKLAPARHHILGMATETALDGLRDKIEIVAAGVDRHRLRLEGLRRLETQIQTLSGRLEDAKAVDTGALAGELSALDERESDLNTRLGELEKENADLRDQLDDAEKAYSAADKTYEDTVAERAKTEAALAEVTQRIQERTADIAAKAHRSGAAVLNDKRGFLSGFSVEAVWENALTDVPYGEAEGLVVDIEALQGAINALQQHRLPRGHDRIESENGRFLEHLQAYLLDHDIPRPAALDAEERDEAAIGAWVTEEVQRLADNEIVSYEEKAQEAYEEARKHFMSDFVAKMRDAFDAMDQRFSDLNKQLRRHDFHGLFYKFIRKADPLREDMYTLIEAADEIDLEGRVFGNEGEQEDERVSRALARLEEIALDPEATMKDIADPKLYFNYDIQMLDADGTPRTDLSKRVHTASGGQLQTPFYVAIAAGLRSACYPDRHAVDGGLTLSMFDEAFNRMDQASVRNSIEFMRDIGLQVFVAAPDEKRIMFSQMVDTVISISRNMQYLSVDVQRIKEKTHEEFAKENPRLEGFTHFRDRLKSLDSEAAE